MNGLMMTENKRRYVMDKEYLAKLCAARDCLCGFCEVLECEKCIVAHLIDDAYNEYEEENTDEE